MLHRLIGLGSIAAGLLSVIGGGLMLGQARGVLTMPWAAESSSPTELAQANVTAGPGTAPHDTPALPATLTASPAPTATTAPSPTPTATTTLIPTATSGAQIIVTNTGSADVCYVYISPGVDDSWGEDKLESATIRPGSSQGFAIEPNVAYDLRADDCFDRNVAEQFNVTVGQDQEFRWSISPGDQGVAKVTLINRDSTPICFVNFSLSTDDDWGPARLATDSVIAPGDEVTFFIPTVGEYDLRALDCQRNTIGEKFSEQISAGEDFTWEVGSSSSQVVTETQPQTPSQPGLYDTAQCPYPGDRWGRDVWQAYQAQLGCAKQTFHHTPLAAYQEFSGGMMVWEEQSNRVYVLRNNGVLYVFDVAAAPQGYDSTTSSSMKGAFEWVWDNYPVVRSLTSPRAAEANPQGFDIQYFDGGVIFFFPEKGNYTLFYSGSWIRN